MTRVDTSEVPQGGPKGASTFVAAQNTAMLQALPFADPENQAARALLADTFEQLGYAAESSTWRNAYLFGAQELRQGMPKAPPRAAMPRETPSNCGMCSASGSTARRRRASTSS